MANKNKVELINGTYIITYHDGSRGEAKRWFEKKTNKWYIHLPVPNPSGREYISESKMVDNVFIFDNKESEPRTLTKSNWRAQLNSDELSQLEAAEATVERLRILGSSRVPKKLDLTTEDGIIAAIKAMEAQLAKMKGNQA